MNEIIKQEPKKRKLFTKKFAAIQNQEQIPETKEVVSPEMMIMEAMKQGASIDTLEKLLNLRDRIQKDQAEKAFREAMSRFQGKCPIIPKRKAVKNKPEKGGGIRYKFAPIDKIEKIIQPIREECQFSHIFKTEVIEKPFEGMRVTIIISHIAGHSESTSFDTPMDKEAYMTEPQKWLSATSFSKRVVLCNGYGIVTGDEDNDANFEELEDSKEKEEQDKQIQEARKKLNSLSDYIKEGFKILKYTEKAQWNLCEMHSWDRDKIKIHINQLIDNNKK